VEGAAGMAGEEAEGTAGEGTLVVGTAGEGSMPKPARCIADRRIRLLPARMDMDRAPRERCKRPRARGNMPAT